MIRKITDFIKQKDKANIEDKGCNTGQEEGILLKNNLKGEKNLTTHSSKEDNLEKHSLLEEFIKESTIENYRIVKNNFKKNSDNNSCNLRKYKMKIEEERKNHVSIIIPCKNEKENLKFTVDSIMKSKNNSKFEIIVVDDGSVDFSTNFLDDSIYKDVLVITTNNLGAANARNKGAEIAKGNYLFFCDAHIKVENYWLDNLVSTMLQEKGDLVAPAIADIKDQSSIGYGQSFDDNFKVIWLEDKPEDITEIPIACGCCFGITKEAFEKINGFDHIFQVWGKEDEEICLKSWLYGYKVVINPNVTVRHLFRKKHPYKVTTVNVIYNTLCFAYSHFNKERILKIINIVKNDFYYSVAAEQIENNIDNIFKQRAKYIKERKYDDNFFFQKFIIPF